MEQIFLISLPMRFFVRTRLDIPRVYMPLAVIVFEINAKIWFWWLGFQISGQNIDGADVCGHFSYHYILYLFELRQIQSNSSYVDREQSSNIDYIYLHRQYILMCNIISISRFRFCIQLLQRVLRISEGGSAVCILITGSNWTRNECTDLFLVAKLSNDIRLKADVYI